MDIRILEGTLSHVLNCLPNRLWFFFFFFNTLDAIPGSPSISPVLLFTYRNLNCLITGCSIGQKCFLFYFLIHLHTVLDSVLDFRNYWRSNKGVNTNCSVKWNFVSVTLLSVTWNCRKDMSTFRLSNRNWGVLQFNNQDASQFRDIFVAQVFRCFLVSCVFKYLQFWLHRAREPKKK